MIIKLMKHNKTLFTILFLFLSCITLFAENKSQSNEKVIFKNEKYTFSLSQTPFQITVRSSDGAAIFRNSQAPSFKIDGEW